MLQIQISKYNKAYAVWRDEGTCVHESEFLKVFSGRSTVICLT